MYPQGKEDEVTFHLVWGILGVDTSNIDESVSASPSFSSLPLTFDG